MATKVRAKKFFLTVQDDRFEDRKQSSILSLLTDGNGLYLNQYGKMFTEDELGNFDIIKINDQAVLEFYPLDGRNNEYQYSFISYDTKQNIFDYGSYEFGNTVSIASTFSTVSAASSSVVYRIPQNFSSSKILVELSSSSGSNYEYNEINLVFDGSNVYSTEFGRITLSNDSYKNLVGIGTYDIVQSGYGLDLVFYSNTTESLNCNALGVSIASTNFSAVSSRKLRYADVESKNISIGSSSLPTNEIITSYSLNYNFGYFIVQITDNTNNQIQLSEIAILNNEVTSTIIEYGNVYSNGPLGSFDSTVSSSVELLFTPNPDIDISITLLQHSVSYLQFASFPISINFKNAELSTGISKFSSSSDLNFKKDFDLTYKFAPIFEKRFDGSAEYSSTNLSGLDLTRDLIYIPGHFFTSGEKVNYRSESFKFIELLSTQASSTAGIGTDLINVDSTLGIDVNDYFGEEYIPITGINLNTISLASTISSEITIGSTIRFYGLFDSDSSEESTISSIGIADTYISGVGVTDKLSGDLYVYKYDDKFIGLSTSPSDALSKIPKLINFNSVGIGDNHYITATNQNSKCIILIDNIIQSPIVSTGITASIQNDLELLDTTLYFSGIGSFFGGDLIKIDNEIMKINSVGVGSTTFVEVERPLMGTILSTHSKDSLITKLKGNYNIVQNKIYFSEAPYGPIYDEVNGDINIRSTFQGRVFLRSGISGSSESTYQNNYIFDDISNQFDAVTKDYTLTSSNQNIAGFSTSNSILLINNIFQSPENDYNLSQPSSETKLNFTGTATSALYDPNNAGVPRGGIIVSVGSSNGFGYQPLISAGGTATVSIAGTIQSISIGNSGSGYRYSSQPIVRVGVQTLSTGSPNIEYIGIASIVSGNVVSVAITNPGVGYTSSNPPQVVFDEPLSYSDLNLIHTPSSSGIGSQAKIDIVVGQGSSIIDFTITNYGYSYKEGDVLTVESGGLSGIPTDTSKPFAPFLITVERTYTDDFSGWSVGQLEKLDDIDSLFNGTRRTFPISNNGNRFAIIARDGSNIDLKAVLLIFINDVLQEPDVAYTFNGGSLITFTEAPKSGDKCRIVFYKGTPNVDVVDVDILETVKIGDTLDIVGDEYQLKEKTRLVTDIILPDTVETNPYNSVGITSDLELLRPVKWCKQRNDTVVGGIQINKNRINYEPNIFPSSNLIQSIGVGVTQIFVDSVKTIFDAENENVNEDFYNKIEIIDNSILSVAIATATVSIGGTIQLVNIVDGGVGYTTNPLVSIQNPIGIGSTGRASLSASITSGTVTSIDISSAGYGYTYTNPPIILIEPPTLNREYIEGVSYFGDFGIISGINTSNVGFASTALVFDLYIPQDSYLRDTSITNPAINESEIQQGYYFKVSNSNVGNGVTSLRSDGTIIGIGTTGLDNIYQVISVSTGTTDVYGVGSATVVKVTVSVSDYNGLSGIGYSSYYGDYSWGLINVPNTINAFSVNSDYGIVGLNSTPIVRRYNELAIENYNSL
ncbi:MAG: hypothetical protein ACO3UU_01865 [Minisyncoccia bacterium]